MRAAPDPITQLAAALVRRPDVSHANALAGGTDLVCVIRAPLGDSRLLHAFGHPAHALWTGYGHPLSDRQAQQILAEPTGPVSGDQRSVPTAEDRPIFEALAEDGRTPQSQPAARTGWSVARVGRRMTALEACGALFYEVSVRH
jgi:hypothetical protein